MQKKAKLKSFKKGFCHDWGDALLWAFVVAMLIRNYTFQNFKIPSSSMEQTLLIGDYLVGNKMKYFFADPKRGEIVTFRSPDDPIEPQPRDRYIRLIAPIYWSKDRVFFAWHEKKNVVKRVIGMPGDTVEIINKVVYINGQVYTTGHEQTIDRRIFPREETHCLLDGEPMGSRDNYGPVVVPDGHYFVLGDNRDMSYDSRFFGFLPRDAITGTTAMIFFSRSESGTVRTERAFTLVR
jgi:signal peptidase I